MNADEWVKIIAAGGVALAAVMTALAAILGQLRETHRLMNSRMDELLAVTKASAHAEGILEGTEAQRPKGANWNT